MVNVNLLKSYMVKAGYTQKMLAQELGISEQTLTRKLKKRVFGTDEASKIVELFEYRQSAGRIFWPLSNLTSYISKEVRAMTYREYATMDRLMQGITPAPVEYIAEELGGEKFKTVCDDIYAVLKENELSVEQAEVMLEVVKAHLKKIAKI
mgnify:FL=1